MPRVARFLPCLFGLLTSVGCGGAGDEHAAAAPDAGATIDAPSADAPSVEVSSSSGACGEAELRHSKTAKELLLAIDELVVKINEKGASAYVDTPDLISTRVQHVHADLPAAVGTDPRPAILGWLASLRGAPVAPDEYAPSPERPTDSPAGGFLAGFVRKRIGATPLGDVPLEAFHVTVQANGAVWRVGGLTVNPPVFFANEDDARVHVRCAPKEPPPATKVREETFRGVELEGCIQVGTYEYRSNASDEVRFGPAPWGEGSLWTIGGTKSGDGGLTWLPQRGAQLMIAKSNYWPRIGYADCYCHGETSTGFTLIVNAITGQILRYTPAVNCVVC